MIQVDFGMEKGN